MKNSLKSLILHIQLIVNKIPIPALKSALSSLFNSIEDLISENDELKIKYQKSLDENNRLKGEQGKPEFKPAKKKDGNISSESERKNAEKDLDQEADRIGFRMPKSKIKLLAEKKIPLNILEALTKIHRQTFSNENSFIEELELELGEEIDPEVRKLLIGHARYKKRISHSKVQEIHIDNEVHCPVDKSLLPSDAISKGTQQKIVQDIILKTDNTLFIREIFYSPSLKKTFLGELPSGYEGDYGPNINANILSMKYVSGMTIPKIKSFLMNIGIIISNSTISRKLTKPESMDVFHNEFNELYSTALEDFSHLQIDDTSTRINGERHYTQIVCNDLCTLFFTTKRKDRLTILDILNRFRPRKYLLNAKTLNFLEEFNIGEVNIALLKPYLKDEVYQEEDLEAILKKVFGDKKQTVKSRILEACAICCYREEAGLSRISALICDDAPQFKMLTEFLALCWVHIGRHFKKMTPFIDSHQEELKMFLSSFWEYYGKLVRYKKNPTSQNAELLSQEFDRLFSTITDYDTLNDRIAKTKKQKENLLVVLEFPEIPLHNNASELGAREEKRRQDISLQTITPEGTKAKDTMMSIVSTCTKLGINIYEFILDRTSKKMSMPSLKEIIKNKLLVPEI